MTTFDDREKGFERKYALDAEIAFKINARKGRLLGLWAAAKMGLSGPAADDYAKSAVVADLEQPGDEDLLAKIIKDLAAAGAQATQAEVRAEADRCEREARAQIAGNKE